MKWNLLPLPADTVPSNMTTLNTDSNSPQEIRLELSKQNHLWKKEPKAVLVYDRTQLKIHQHLLAIWNQQSQTHSYIEAVNVYQSSPSDAGEMVFGHAYSFQREQIDRELPSPLHLSLPDLSSFKEEDLKKVIFLDRDGIINEDTHYLKEEDQIRWMPDTFETLKELAKYDYQFVIVTNQSGIARGYFTLAELKKLHEAFSKKFKEMGLPLLDLFCPFHQKAQLEEYRKDSILRKPEPGMILLAAEKWGINLSQSFMIGDKESDRIKLPYLTSLLFQGQYPIENKELVFDSMREIATYILNQ